MFGGDWTRIGSRAGLWISFVSDCVFGFTLYAWGFFGFNGIWNLEEDLRLSFVSLVCFISSGKPWAKGGSVD